MGDYFDKIIIVAFTAVVGLITWLFRTVLAGRESIELLKTELKSSELQRQRDREELLEIKLRLNEIRKEIREDYRELREEIRKLVVKE